MEIFSILVPEKHSELYNSIAHKSIQFISASTINSSQSQPQSNSQSSLDSKKRPIDSNSISSSQSNLSQNSTKHQSNREPLSSSTTTSSSSSPSVFSSELLAQESRASKRAKMMQSTATATTTTTSNQQSLSTSSSSSTPSSSALARSTIKTLLSTVDSIKLSKDPTSSSNNSIQNNQQEKLKKIMCIICTESPPKIACASPCGHICCEECWEKWLKVNSICPMCRVRTTRSDIARIRVAS